MVKEIVLKCKNFIFVKTLDKIPVKQKLSCYPKLNLVINKTITDPIVLPKTS